VLDYKFIYSINYNYPQLYTNIYVLNHYQF